MGNGAGKVKGASNVKVAAANARRRANEEVAWNKVEAAMHKPAALEPDHNDDDEQDFVLRASSNNEPAPPQLRAEITFDFTGEAAVIDRRAAEEEDERKREEERRAAIRIQSSSRRLITQRENESLGLSLSTEDRNKCLEPTWATCGGGEIEGASPPCVAYRRAIPHRARRKGRPTTTPSRDAFVGVAHAEQLGSASVLESTQIAAHSCSFLPMA